MVNKVKTEEKAMPHNGVIYRVVTTSDGIQKCATVYNGETVIGSVMTSKWDQDVWAMRTGSAHQEKRKSTKYGPTKAVLFTELKKWLVESTAAV